MSCTLLEAIVLLHAYQASAGPGDQPRPSNMLTVSCFYLDLVVIALQGLLVGALTSVMRLLKSYLL